MEGGTAYDAFISYSHAKDKPIAAALQSVVQRLGKPWYRRRALRVFRDDTSLSATPHLWPSIEQALSQSRFLILLASPEAAASPWVGKEIEYWLETAQWIELLDHPESVWRPKVRQAVSHLFDQSTPVTVPPLPEESDSVTIVTICPAHRPPWSVVTARSLPS